MEKDPHSHQPRIQHLVSMPNTSYAHSCMYNTHVYLLCCRCVGFVALYLICTLSISLERFCFYIHVLLMLVAWGCKFAGLEWTWLISYVMQGIQHGWNLYCTHGSEISDEIMKSHPEWNQKSPECACSWVEKSSILVRDSLHSPRLVCCTWGHTHAMPQVARLVD